MDICLFDPFRECSVLPQLVYSPRASPLFFAFPLPSFPAMSSSGPLPSSPTPGDKRKADAPCADTPRPVLDPHPRRVSTLYERLCGGPMFDFSSPDDEPYDVQVARWRLERAAKVKQEDDDAARLLSDTLSPASSARLYAALLPRAAALPPGRTWVIRLVALSPASPASSSSSSSSSQSQTNEDNLTQL
jgi:hypothetical protein